MTNRNLQHPDITRAEWTGYPSSVRIVFVCPDCESDILHGQTVYTMDGRSICERCFIERVQEMVEEAPEQFAEYLEVTISEAKRHDSCF